MDEFRLSDKQQAILMLIKGGHDNELNPKWIKQVESLQKLNLIQLKPNTLDEWMLTIKGEDCIVKHIVIKYPMESRGDIGSYNKTIQSMDGAAVNALICAMINEQAFGKIPTSTARVLGQHLIDTMFHHKWGKVLIGKVREAMQKSENFFKSVEGNNERKAD